MIYCSYIQIANEKVQDLLDEMSTDTSRNLRFINETGGDNVQGCGPLLAGLNTYKLEGEESCIQLLRLGEQNRQQMAQ